MAEILKSEKRTTFVERCLSDQAAVGDIDDFVEQWHAGRAAGSLRGFLGFTREEYALWVEKPGAIKMIMFARRCGMSLRDAVLLCDKPAISAKAPSVAEAREVMSWLRKTNRAK